MSKPSKQYERIPKEQAIEILKTIEQQLENKFDELRNERYNPNTKGYDYEEIVRFFLESYVGGAFEILVRVGVLDIELKVL